MSGPSDKARFYIEQTVPQLQEFKEKNLFTQDEIRDLVKKRSDFEHKVHARGTQAVYFARYAAWEISLEKLRQKRCKRLHIKSPAYSGQARIFNIFDRGTKKHPGDAALWISFLEYARSSKMNKKFKSVLTAALRLHPTRPEFWLYAVKCSLESEADINSARSYFQRGLRFCTSNSVLWIEYAKLEMIYLTKIVLRRKILRLDKKNPDEHTTKSEGEENMSLDFTEDMIAIPNFELETAPSNKSKDIEASLEFPIKDLLNTPALSGAIPLAIFDAARKQSFFQSSTAADFFDMFGTFSQVPCLPRILQHVIDCMMELYPTDALTWICFTRQPTVGIDPLSSEFPAALSLSLERLAQSLEKTNDKAHYSKITMAWLEQIRGLSDLDDGIKTALEHIMLRLK